MDEIYFKIILIVLMTIFMGIKIQLTNKYVTKPEEGNNYPSHINIFLGFNAITMLLPFALIYPLFDVFIHPMPLFLRFLGIVDFILAIGLMIWQMRTLGVNISSTHQERSLITTGPYQFVRHPLYLIFIAIAIDAWLISANWLLIIGIPMTIIAGKIRANFEEKILIEEYGEEYLTYASTTGQLFPKLF